VAASDYQSLKSKAFDVTLSKEKREEFTHWLCRQIQEAETARPVTQGETEYWWTIYEQGRTRSNSAMPWQDAADLTSYLGTTNVDALRARMVRTVFVEPVYTVEGWGESAKKAPFVEDIHQWWLESEGLQAFLARVFLASLIETRAVLEVYEDTTERRVRKDIRAKIAMTPDGRHMLDEEFQPVLERDLDGNFVEVVDDMGGMIGTAETTIDTVERVRKGPGYRILDYNNFLVLPGHAKEKADIWGYAKKFTRRWDLLQEDAKRGMYDKAALDSLHDSNEVTSAQSLSGNPEPVAAQDGSTAEKELREVQLLYNLDGKGLRWYVATIHLPTFTLLRLKHEDQAVHRYILFVPFPRSDRSHEGYSFVGHKLITVIEEHTAWRNMLADRAAMELSAPIKRLAGALWDPDLQPFGPKAVIDVRDMKELEAMQLPPAMQGAISREQEIIQASERIAGMNDVVVTGSNSTGDATLGEFEQRQEAVVIRIDEVIKNVQESLEDLGQVRHAIYKNCVRQYGEKGMPMPMGLQQQPAPQQGVPGLDQRGGMIDTQTITLDMLEGTFRFKPRGSTETADVTRQRGDYIQWLQALPMLIQTWPAMAMQISGNIEAAKSALENGLRLFRQPDKQAWLTPPPPPIDPLTGLPMPPQMPGMGMNVPGMGGPPGAPPGAPPQPPQGPPNGQ
jgi:hypothetical protein